MADSNIKYTIHRHSNSSQRVEGTARHGTSREEVEKVTRGSFGGRFERFHDAGPDGGVKFSYIAYTD